MATHLLHEGQDFCSLWTSVGRVWHAVSVWTGVTRVWDAVSVWTSVARVWDADGCVDKRNPRLGRGNNDDTAERTQFDGWLS